MAGDRMTREDQAMPDFGKLAAGLRRWAATHDSNVRAAVELLITSGTWLYRDDFPEAAIQVDPHDGLTWINWGKAWEFANSPVPASGGELALLKAALTIGDDSLHLSRLDRRNRVLVAAALASALGVEFPGTRHG